MGLPEAVPPTQICDKTFTSFSHHANIISCFATYVKNFSTINFEFVPFLLIQVDNSQIFFQTSLSRGI